MTAPKGLFSPSLISHSVTSALPESYTIRPLERSDYHKGFFECIQVLTSTGDISEERFLERYDYMKNLGVHYFLVIEHEGKIVGTGTLMVERKLYVPCPSPGTILSLKLEMGLLMRMVAFMTLEV
jgi:glucosamine-phosphate N-acetyltransferase